jgi:hypothetical protein
MFHEGTFLNKTYDAQWKSQLQQCIVTTVVGVVIYFARVETLFFHAVYC